MTDSQDEIREFVRKELLIQVPEIVSAVESLNKPIQELTEAMNRLAEKL